MRQAGRYLSSYQDFRKRYTIEQICHDPKLASEISWKASEYLSTDAAIIFSDIAIPLENLGYSVKYVEGTGPVPELKLMNREYSAVSEASRAIREFKQKHPEIPIIGFIGGPLTLSSYVVGKGPDKDLKITKGLLSSGDEKYHALMLEILEILKWEVTEQIRQGADCIQIFDSWLGFIDREDAENILIKFVKPITEIVKKEGKKSIYFSTGTSGMIETLIKSGSDFLSLDSKCSLQDVRAEFPEIGLQGNLDPRLLRESPEKALEKSLEIIRFMRNDPKYIFNLGHGVLPGTDQLKLREITKKIRGEIHE